MTDHVDWDRLARYVSGEATPGERAEVERWAADDPGAQARLESIAHRWAAAAHPVTPDVDAAWARLSARIASQGTPDAPEETTAAQPVGPDIIPLPVGRWRRAARSLPIAAAIVLAAGLTLIWRAQHRGPDASLGASATVAAGETRTGIGERRTLDLADGSEIVLGAASVLRIGEGYGRPERHVYLAGQAVFRVRHDATRPFLVHAAGTVSRDLGTEFEIRAYPGDSTVRVAVVSGTVGVVVDSTAGGTETTLRTHDVIHLGASGTPEVLHDQNVDRLLAWTNGRIGFDNAPLTEVAGELEHWFDIECHLADPELARLHLTNTGLPTDSLDEALQVIQLSLKSLGVRVERRGRVVTFSGPVRPAPDTAGASAPRRAEAGG
jgi:transmembrane sensor